MMKEKTPVVIFECANAHGGNLEILMSTIKGFSKITYPEKHIKFQPLQADAISLSDFAWFETYKKLEFSKTEWTKIINKAHHEYDGVWLDIFDVFGVEVLSENLLNISGIKLQASVLWNYEVTSALSKLCVDDKYLIINISGYEISEIERILNEISNINVKKLILQIGFQSYPTSVEDTALQKIQILRSAFNSFELCIADHLSATDDLACIIPLMAVTLGCGYVEKHICLDRSSSKYDYYSSLEPSEMKLLVNRLETSSLTTNGAFISKSEHTYLTNSIQIPISKNKLYKNSLISRSDVIYRRTVQEGIAFSDIVEQQKKHRVLSDYVTEGSAITKADFRDARIGVIVACRMKSSRLKKKAILPINGISSVERCLTNCLNIPGADVVVLATSTTEEDAELKNYTLDEKVDFFQGDPDDVIKRYINVCDAHNIDVIIRVTADCPVISTEIAETLLEHHFATGADYTAARDCAVGTACEIYNTEVLRSVIGYLGEAQYSEYMTWYLQNNKELFKVELVDLPDKMLRDYRLTLDHPEDLELFQKIFEKLESDSKQPTLENVFEVLDSTPSLASINSHIKLKYNDDKELIELLNIKTKIKP